MTSSKIVQHLMPSYPSDDVLGKFPPFNFVLFYVPPQFLEIQVDKVPKILSFCVHPTKNNHVFPHQNSTVTSPPLNGFFIGHLQGPAAPSLQIYQIDCIVADSTLSTDVISAHSSKDNDEPSFVEDRTVIASGRTDIHVLDPTLTVEGVLMGNGEGIAAVSTDNDGSVFIDGCGVPFSGLWSPALKFMVSGADKVLYIFIVVFDDCFFDDFSDFGVESGQSFLFIVIDIQYFLVLEGFFDVVVQFYLPEHRELCFNFGVSLLVGKQNFGHIFLATVQTALTVHAKIGLGSHLLFAWDPHSWFGQFYFREGVEALMDSGDERRVIGSMDASVPFGHLLL